MPMDKGQSKEVDLERTDRLPVLDGTLFDHEAEDGVDRIESVSSTVVLPVMAAAPGSSQQADFPRASGVGMPSLVESMRTVEERIARHAANSEIEESRARETNGALAEQRAVADAARARAEESLRDAERRDIEARTVRDSLDARLTALQEEHANELKISQSAAALMAAQATRFQSELQAARHALSAANAQAATYLEQLRTREYRRGFDQNLLRELDARVGAAQVGNGALEAQRDQLRQQVGELQSRLASQDDVIATLQANASIDAAAKAQHAQQLQQRELARAVLSDQIEALHTENARLKAVIAAHDAALAEAYAAGTAETQRLEAKLKAVEGQRSQLSAAVVMLRDEAEAREVEMAVMVANLQEARRPVQPVDAQLKRLTEDLALKVHAVDRLNEENRELRAALERAKSALDERESTLANASERASAGSEPLGVVPPSTTAPAAPVECSAELVRLGLDPPTSHVLGRRTRIGRATGCELQIDYTSVSRHHALVLMGPRDVIIEDLNSTNGVIVNGRKVTRQLLNDGDLIVIGEVQFRLALRLAPRAPDDAAQSAPGGTATG